MTKEQTNPFGEGFKEADAGAFIYWKEAVPGTDDGKKCIPVGGSIKGTLLAVDEYESQINAGEMQKVYTIKTEEGEEYKIGSRGSRFDVQMRGVLVGQYVGFLYTEDIPSKKKGYSAFKLIKVYPGQMNPDYVSSAVAEEQNVPVPTTDEVEPFKG